MLKIISSEVGNSELEYYFTIIFYIKFMSEIGGLTLHYLMGY